MPRADKYTPVEAQNKVLYSDFLPNFDLNPVTGNLAKVTNENSVKQSIRNLILTNRGEVPYSPLHGSRIRSLLFELNSPSINSLLDKEIRETIDMFEPRVNIVNIKIDNDGGEEITVTIAFNTINSPEITEMSIILERVR